MSVLNMKQATMAGLDVIRAFYWKLMDSSKSLEQILQWKKNQYPSDSDWCAYIDRKEMYLVYEEEKLVAAVALTEIKTDEYRHINWKASVTDDAVLVIHLLAVDPTQQGRGLGMMVLGEIIMMAKSRGKKVVRLDAIETNVPAQRLYEKYGFVQYGKIQAYYESVGFADFCFYQLIL